MKEENNIDKLFRDKLYNRDFEFDKNHWEAAEKLIDADEKKKKNWFGGKLALTIISTIVVLSFVGGYFILNTSNDENSAQEVSIQPKDKKSNNQLSEKEIVSASVKSVEVKKSEKITKSVHAEISPVQKETEIGPSNSEIVRSEIKNAPQKITGTSDEVEFPKAKVEKEKIEINPEQNKIETAESKTKTKQFEAEATSSEIKTEQAEIKTNLPESEIMTSEIVPVQSETKSTQIETESISVKTENVPAETKSVQKENGNITAHPMETENNTGNEEPEVFKLNKAVITLNKEGQSVKEENSEPAQSEQKEKLPLKDRLNWLRHVSLGVSGGANISQGLLNTGTSRAGISARPIAGLRIAYQLNEKVDIETGLLYDYRAGVNSKIKTLSSADISNNINYFSTNSTLSLHYIDIPLHLTYKYGKQSFIIGMQYAHLINTYSEVLKTKEENGTITIEKNTKQWNKNDGRFSSFDLAGMFGYEYEFSERLKICARYNTGLFDVTDDNTFGNSVRDKNNQFRIMIDYRFLKY